MSGERWGDSTSEDELDLRITEPVHTGLNDGTISTQSLLDPIPQGAKVTVPPSRYSAEAEEDDGNDEHSEMEEEEESSDDEEDPKERERRLVAARELAQQKKEEKKKKQESLNDQLDDLDDILNELGIEAKVVEEESGVDATTEDVAVSSGANSKRRKKEEKEGRR
jgi:hypothetical protein